MKNKQIIRIAFYVMAGFSAPAQNLLLNGSFEAPVVASNAVVGTTPEFWTSGGTTPARASFIHSGNSGDSSVWPLPKDGQQFGDMSNEAGTTMSQTFSIANQGNYVLSWFDNAGHAGGLATSPYSTVILAGASIVATHDYDAYHPTFGVWMARSIQLTLTPGTYTLRFRSEGVYNGLDSLIDKVALEQLPGDETPNTTPSITWANPADISYGTALGNIQLNATASLAGTFVYTPPAGTVLPAGATQPLSVAFTPAAANFASATASVSINVLKSILTVTADRAERPYGTTNPLFQGTMGGFVNGETAAVLSGAPSFSCSATALSPVGAYDIVPALGR